MKVVAFNGSSRKNGNTHIALTKVCEALTNEGIETEIIQVGGKRINPCKVCNRCKKEKDGFCHGYNNDSEDILNECVKKMYGAQGILIGSPVYFGSVTPEIKALIDRTGYCSRSGGFLLKRKVCAGVVAVRRQGAQSTLDQINSLFALSEVIIPCSSYWNMAIGREIGEVLNDEEGMSTLQRLGENMAWLLKKIST